LRARYSEQHLREWGRLGNLHARLTTGDSSSPSPEKLEWVENARDEIELMQAETVVCPSCPACLPEEVAGEGESVGCLGRITYPIEAQFEKFLADRVQLVLDTIDSADQPRLLRILVDAESPFDGEATKIDTEWVTDAGRCDAAPPSGASAKGAWSRGCGVGGFFWRRNLGPHAALCH